MAIGMMNFTLKDIKKQFGEKTYSLGIEYVQKKRVQQIQRSGNLIRSQVKDSSNQTYQQNTFIKSTTEGIQFQGTCSCPLILNCHHVAAVLMTIVQKNSIVNKNKNSPTETPLSNWVQKLYSTIYPLSPDALVKTETTEPSPHRLLFVLSPDQSDKRLFLSICKVRYKSTGGISAITSITDIDSLLTDRPDYFTKDDEEPVRLFIAMRSGSNLPVPGTIEPKGSIGAQILKILVSRKQLYWTNALTDIAKGLVFPLKAAPAREAKLDWVESGPSMKLKWQFVPSTDKSRKSSSTIDYILPTEPAWYMENLSCGELILPPGAPVFSISEVQDLIAQSPVIPIREKKTVARLLAEKGIENIIPQPERLTEVVRENIIPKPILYLGSKSHFYSETETPTWFDYAQLKFDYDGQIVFLDSSLPIIRQISENEIERIVRHPASESATFELLKSFGFHSEKGSSTPLGNIPGAISMKSPTDWLHFTQDEMSGLEADGWKIEKSPDYRYDLQNIEKWYASITENDEDLDKDWFSLELGIFRYFPCCFP